MSGKMHPMKTANKQDFLDSLATVVGNAEFATRKQCLTAANAIGLVYPPSWFVCDVNREAGRGLFRMNPIQSSTETPFINSETTEQMTQMTTENQSIAFALAASSNGGEMNTLVPTTNQEYVPWGHYDDILKIVKSELFAPIFVTGMSGNGKTTMIEQICSKLGRECFRVNITEGSDEDELIGSWRLINGDMEWNDGPVILAMKRGAILLLDEVDLGTEKIMCLQAPLEGKGIFMKKTREFVTPKKGFNIIATANTKGKGSDDGRFVGTRVMNEANLDRYDFTFEQEYATPATEKKILLKAMKKFGEVDEQFADCLVKWTGILRKSFVEGAVDEIVSTRRVVNICKAFAMFGNKKKAISLCLARFDADTQTAFLSLYNKIDAEPIAGEVAASDPAPAEAPNAMDPPF